MLVICAYYASIIMLNALATCYAHNYAGLIGSSLLIHVYIDLFVFLDYCEE